MKNKTAKIFICAILIIFLDMPQILFADATYAYVQSPASNDLVNHYVNDSEWHDFEFQFKASTDSLVYYIKNASSSNSVYSTYGSFGLFGVSNFSFDPTITIQNFTDYPIRFKIYFYVKCVSFYLDNLKVVGFNEPARLNFYNLDSAPLEASMTVDVNPKSVSNVGVAQWNGMLATYDTFVGSGQYTSYDGLNVFCNPRLIFSIRVQTLSSFEPINNGDFLVAVANINSGISYAGTLAGNNKYLCSVANPDNIPDYRFLAALRNIWTAINGNGTQDVASVIQQEMQNQTEQLTNGFDNTSINQSNTDLQNSLKQLEDSEALSGQALDNLNNFEGFDETALDEALAGMKFVSQTTDTIINSNVLIRALVLGAFIFFVVSVIVGVRRYI